MQGGCFEWIGSDRLVSARDSKLIFCLLSANLVIWRNLLRETSLFSLHYGFILAFVTLSRDGDNFIDNYKDVIVACAG